MSRFIYSLMGAAVAGFTVSAAAQVAITTRPRFEDRGAFTYLVLADNKHSYQVAWAMPPKIQFVPATLDTNRVYSFIVYEKPYKSITVPELRRVQLDGQTIYDIEICEVHKTKMEHKEVRIAYGLPGPDRWSGDTERRLFPHGREYSLGGCVVSADSPKSKKIYVCANCKKACEEWNARNKTK